ncbi:MAG: alpha/beta hydrolase [Pseudomonadota bacterium]
MMTPGPKHPAHLLSWPEDGPLIVMVHGYSTPNFIFEQNVTAMVAAGYRVLRYDHFGRGWSDRPSTRYDADLYDRALIELLETLELREPFGLVGLSMGGLIAAEFTARHPERVERLFLFVPAGLSTAGASGMMARLITTPLIGDWIWRMVWRDILLGDPQYDESALAPENRLAGDVTEQMDYRGYGEALLSTLRRMPMAGQASVFERLGATNVPVAAVFGEADQTVLIASASEMADILPEADIRIVPEAGHGLNYQNHDVVNPWLLGWFGEGAIQ